MMAIRDIERRNRSECFDPFACFVYSPKCVLDLAVAAKIIDRLLKNGLIDELSNVLSPAKGEQDQTSLCTNCEQVFGAVLYFVGPGLFVLFDQSRFVLIQRAACNDTSLLVLA